MVENRSCPITFQESLTYQNKGTSPKA